MTPANPAGAPAREAASPCGHQPMRPGISTSLPSPLLESSRTASDTIYPLCQLVAKVPFLQSHHCLSGCEATIIWVTSPSLHPGQKLVTFWESLSHFCDQIQNGTIKTKNIFLHNFSGRVRICNHFLCRVIFRTPREIVTCWG